MKKFNKNEIYFKIKRIKIFIELIFELNKKN